MTAPRRNMFSEGRAIAGNFQALEKTRRVISKHWKLSLAGIIAIAAFAMSAGAAVTSMEAFEQIPTLDGGRVMPVDSFARQTLLTISGKSTFARKPAINWLAQLMFSPEASETNEVFLVNNEEVVEALGIEAKGRSRYSFAQLRPHVAELSRLAQAASKLESEARSPVEKELLQLYGAVNQYYTLSQAMQFAIPQNEFLITDPQLRKDLTVPAGEPRPLNFFDMSVRAGPMSGLLQKNREVPPDQWTDYHKELFRVASAFKMWSEESHNSLPAIIPMAGPMSGLWVGAWDAVAKGVTDEAIQREISALTEMTTAYRAGQQAAFDIACRTFHASVTKRAPDQKQIAHLQLEVKFNKTDSFYRAEMCYGFAFLGALFCVMSRNRWLYRATIALAAVALVPHTYGIIARMIIMGRPPVTNLYATFIFVAWTSALLGLALEFFQRNRLGLITASAAGLGLLMTAARFATDGDTMGVMIAVLDSNFWLATHVVCISIGYAGTCVAGLLGHIYLLQALKKAPDDPQLRETYRATFGTLGFGLIFSFLGTMLGGVWADQSWGRFWGWDPKENGALVIVIWTAIVFHARLAKMIGPRGFAAGCVLGVIAVLMAWMGVNLLGVGLHSYGFTSAMAKGFVISCTVEAAFVAIVTPLAKKSTVADPDTE